MGTQKNKTNEQTQQKQTQREQTGGWQRGAEWGVVGEIGEGD